MGGQDDREDMQGWSGAQSFQHVKSQHDKLLSELQDESRRLEQAWSRDNRSGSSSSSAGPFSTFKKFVDNGLSSISDALKDLPTTTTTSELTLTMQQEQDRWRAEEQDISHRWTGSTDSPDHIQMEQSRSTQREQEEAMDSAAQLLDIAQELNAHIPPAKVEALFRDDQSNLGVLDSSLSADLPRWLSVDWFKRDPYSPVRLEGHPALGQHGAKWRAAFEDLLDASLDKPMCSVERVGMRVPHGRPQSTFYGPGLEWMLSLQCRGILPMQLPRLYQSSRTSDIAGVAACPSAVLGAKRLLCTNALTTARPADSALAADFQDLVSAVGTKATADTEADPLPVRAHPDSEQELYESRCLFPAEGMDGHTAEESTRNVHATANESPVRSSSPLEMALLRRGLELAGDEFVSFVATKPNFEELVGKVLRLQEEHDNLEQMTGQAWQETAHAGESSRSEKTSPFSKPELVAEKTRIQEGLWESLLHDVTVTDRRMSGPQQPPMASFQQSSNDQTGSPQWVSGKQMPHVLSALTTTHTTRLPDGTLTTRVALRQRFADGREETSESVHTRMEEPGRAQPEQQQEDEVSSSKRGWFWT